MRTRFASKIALLIFTGAASAQMTPQQQQQLPPSDPSSSQYHSVYLPSLGHGDTVQPSANWKDRWGAIASDGKSTYGIVTDNSSKIDAIRLAIAECRNRGGVGCQIDRTFVNQCAAVIAGDRSSASANAPTEEEAIRMGEAKCVSSGETSCRVYYSGCSLPERIQE